MTKETARTISQICLVGGILIILATCGVCCTGKTSYGPEEFYSKGDGTVGYGAKSYSDNTDTLALMLGVGGPLCIILFIVSAGFHAHAEKLPSALPFPENPPNDQKTSKDRIGEVADYGPDYSDGLTGLKDPLFEDALTQIIVDKRASLVRLQRELRIGYGRAASLLDAMSFEGLIGEMDVETRTFPVLAKAYERLKDIALENKKPDEAE